MRSAAAFSIDHSSSFRGTFRVALGIFSGRLGNTVYPGGVFARIDLKLMLIIAVRMSGVVDSYAGGSLPGLARPGFKPNFKEEKEE